MCGYSTWSNYRYQKAKEEPWDRGRTLVGEVVGHMGLCREKWVKQGEGDT